MRFAVVVAPPAEGTSGHDRLQSLREGLIKAELNVLNFVASANLVRDLGRAIDGVDEGDTLVVYIAGALRMHGETSVALGTGADSGDASEVGLDAIGAALRDRKAPETLLILDGHDRDAAGDSMRAFEVVDAAIHALGAREQGLAVIIGVHATPEATWPFTRFFIQALDDVRSRDARGRATASSVYDRMKEHPELGASVPAFAHVKGAREVELLAAPESPVIIASAHPPIAPPAPLPLPPSAPPAASITSAASISSPPSMAAPPSVPPSSFTRSSLPPPSSVRVPRSRSFGPRPAIEPILADAEKAHAKGEWEAALEGYKKALMVLGEADPSAKASLYANVAEVKRAQGRALEAETNYEKALSADPKHRRSIEALVAMATDAKDWKRAIAHRTRLLATLEAPAEKAAALAAIADVYVTELHDARGAIDALERASAIAPGEEAILERLRAAYEAGNRWANVVEVLGKMGDNATSSSVRAERRFQQADLTMGRLREEPRGLAMLEAALEDDPSHEKALAALVAVRTRRQEWSALDRLYTQLIDRFAVSGDPVHAWDACKRLGALRKDRLHDGPGAVDAWQGALRCKPKDVETRAALAELFVAKGDVDAAIAELEIAASHEPLRAATHRRLFELHRRAGSSDRAWLAATALEELGALNVDQDMLLEQFRLDGGARPTASIDDAAWRTLIAAPGADDVVEAVMRATLPAAIAIRVADLRAARRLVALDPARRMAATSTASIVRTFAFVSQVLGVALPDLYVLDEVAHASHVAPVSGSISGGTGGGIAGLPGGLAAAQVSTPSTAIGAEASSGKSVQQLSFLAARHLAYYRPEHYVLVFFPTLIDLSALFLAAVKLALPDVPVPSHAAVAVTKLRNELEQYATPTMKNELASAVARLTERGGTVDLASWIRSVELTATRAGLLLAGDLPVALGLMNAETRVIADLTVADKRSDLLAFTASRALAELRVRLGIAVRSSLVPPSLAPPKSS